MSKARPRVKFAKRNAGDHDPAECNHTIHGKYIHHHPLTAKDNKKLISIRQQKDIRDIIVPSREPLEIPGILPASEFVRLKKQSYVVTAAERRAMMEENERKKMQMAKESSERKEKFKSIQMQQAPAQGSVLANVESQAKKNNKYLLQRAYDMKLEQEEEIKNANSIILASKCLAIREAQIAEKNLIQRELDEEESRLDRMMEQQRQIGLQEEKKKRDLAEERNQQFVSEIRQQMKENEIQSLIDAERREEEARNINLALIAIQQEERERLQMKVTKRLQVRADLQQANEDAEKYKALQREEERLAEARLQAFMKEKADREAALEAEAKAVKLAKEMDIARLKATQENVADLQAIRDQMNAYRVQEESERNWRKKEKEAAIKKKEMTAQLKRDRQQQIDDIRRAQAAELARDEEEFHKVAEMQYGIFQKEEEKKRRKRELAEKYRREILSQVNEKERERINERKSKMEEGTALRVEQELRQRRIQETLKKKFDVLRQHNVPEQSLNDIQRKINSKLDNMKLN